MISIDNVSKHYGSFQVLTDCTTQVKKGEVIVVCGPSGSGKSTLIKCVNGLEPFQAGTITVDGVSVGDPKTNLSKLRSRVGMVFQHFELFPHMSITDNLTIAQIKVLGRSKDEATDKGLRLLERVGLKAHAHKFPGQLSGGQQQRVAIARALVSDPTIIVADEPTGDLDRVSAREILDLMESLNERLNKTIIMVTHDPKAARRGVSAGVSAMLIAVLATWSMQDVTHHLWVVIPMLAAIVPGIWLAKVPITAVPQRTALSHAFGGLAAGLVGAAKYFYYFNATENHAHLTAFTTVAIVVEITLGFLTFTGSIIAAANEYMAAHEIPAVAGRFVSDPRCTPLTPPDNSGESRELTC